MSKIDLLVQGIDMSIIKKEYSELVDKLPMVKVRKAITDLIDAEMEIQNTVSDRQQVLENFWTLLLGDFSKDEILLFNDIKLRTILALSMSVDSEMNELIANNSDPSGESISRLCVNQQMIKENSLKIIKK